MATTKELLEQAYAASWISGTPNSSNCSGFIKSAGKLLGFYVANRDADGIIEDLERLCAQNALVTTWQKVASLQEALAAIAEGKLVLVGMTAADYGQNNGHIAILLSELAGPHKAPLVYGGAQSSGARSQGDKTIRQVWNPSKHNKLRYFANRIVNFKYS